MKTWCAISLAALLLPALVSPSQGSEKARQEAQRKDEWLAEDKLLHVLTSAYLVGFSYRAYHDQFEKPPDDSRTFAVSVTAVAGIGKELYDMTSPDRSASWKDIAADALGIALGVALFTYLD